MSRADLIEIRSDMAGAVLNMLLIAMENDSSPTEGAIIQTISAAIELLNVPEKGGARD